MRKRFLLMDADTGASGGGDPTPAPAAPAAPPAPAAPAPTIGFGGQPALIEYNPLLQSEPEPMLTPAPENPDFIPQPESPAPPAPALEELDFAGRKVSVVDPVIKEIHRDYSNMLRTFQEERTRAQQLSEQNQVLMQFWQQQQQAASQPPAPPQPEPQMDPEAFMNQWYENPEQTVQQLIQKSMQSIVEQQIKPVLEPIRQERQYNQEVQQLTSKYSDFSQYSDTMQQILQAKPEFADQGLETVYFLAKGLTAQPQVQPEPMTPEKMLADPQFKQQLLSNEQLRQEIVSGYLAQKQQINGQTPPVMSSSQPGGSPPAMPEDRPKTIREGSKLFSKYLGFN